MPISWICCSPDLEVELGLTLCSAQAGFDLYDDSRDNDGRLGTTYSDASDYIVDIREYDVPYHVRVMIDLGTPATLQVTTTPRPDM
jgi:DNA polymerase elongation subunit (family B)